MGGKPDLTETMAVKSSEERLLTLCEAGSVLGVHRNTVRNMTERGVLPYVDLDGVRGRRVALSQLHAYIRRCTTGGWALGDGEHVGGR
jgi:excisionase family DNA binding protein